MISPGFDPRLTLRGAPDRARDLGRGCDEKHDETERQQHTQHQNDRSFARDDDFGVARSDFRR